MSQSTTTSMLTSSTSTDQWDMSLIGELMESNGDCITFTGGQTGKMERGNSAFLTNIVNEGVHHWKFKTNIRFCHYWSSTIGIWKCSEYSIPRQNDIFTLGENNGYGFNLTEGTLLNPTTGNVDPTLSASRYGQRCTGSNVVEMVLDLDKFELKYIINGENCGKAFTVEKASYRAAINLSQIGDSITLYR